MDKVLVTGADGFVGKAMCGFLCDAGCEVHGLIRSGDGSGRLSSVQYHMYRDVCDQEAYRPVMTGIDGVVHLAARVHRMNEASKDPLAEYRRVNVDGARAVAEAAIRAGVRRFVYVSSIKAESPAIEDAYGLSKREAETELARLVSESEMELVIFRPCLVYGPEVKANFLRLLHLAQTGFPLPLAGIDNRRSYLYIGNLTHALYLGLIHEKAGGGVFPISDGQDLSTVELIRYIAEAAGKRPRMFKIPGLLRLVGMLTGRAVLERLTGSLTTDNGLLRQELDWEPPFSVEQGIGRTVNWYIQQKRNVVR